MEFDKQSIRNELEEISKVFTDILKDIEDEQEAFWNSLTTDQQLMVFCSVIRRLSHAELAEGRSYRGILYDVFGFGREAYVRAQDAGFLDLHNSIDTGVLYRNNVVKKQQTDG